MMSWIEIALLTLLGLVLLLVLWLALRRGDNDSVERLERNLRADVQDSARGTRQELAQSLAAMQQSLLTQSGDVARTQNEQIDSFRTQLAATQQALAEQSRAAREAQDAALHRFGQAQAEQLRALAEGNDKRMAEVRQTVEAKLTAIQADNSQRL
jgi:DNA recombination protein RmuC